MRYTLSLSIYLSQGSGLANVGREINLFRLVSHQGDESDPFSDRLDYGRD